MPWISTGEALALLTDKYSLSYRAHEVAAKAIKDGCGHPQRFVRRVALDRFPSGTEVITERLADRAYVDVWGARIEAGSGGLTRYYNVEVHAERLLAYVEEEDLLGWFGLSPEPEAASLSDEQRREIDSLAPKDRQVFEYILAYLKDDPNPHVSVLLTHCKARFGVTRRAFERVLKLARAAAGTKPNPVGRKRRA